MLFPLSLNKTYCPSYSILSNQQIGFHLCRTTNSLSIKHRRRHSQRTHLTPPDTYLNNYWVLKRHSAVCIRKCHEWSLSLARTLAV